MELGSLVNKILAKKKKNKGNEGLTSGQKSEITPPGLGFACAVGNE
jgi:hypothetical protein